MDSTTHKDSAQLAREAEEQRQKLDQRLDEIQQRLSPGQLIDEALSYTKHGGGEFAGNLAHAVTANPLPVALVGVGLFWLIAGGGVQAAAAQLQGHSSQPQPAAPRYPAYPYARVGGSEMQRTRHEQDETGEWYSHFADDLGKTYKAKSNESGNRIGHFMDDTGKKFSGFIDESGNRVEQFRDEAGSILANASEWASHTWHDVTDAVSSTLQSGLNSAANLGGQLTRQAGNLGGQMQNHAGNLGGSLQHQASNLTGQLQSGANQASRMMSSTLYQQPLIAGALAFAAGAALGATLPHTSQEDEILGAASDKAKREAGKLAASAYEKGKEQVAEVYEDVSGKVGAIYEDAKSTLTDAASRPN
ncbi:MAG: nutrient deprivation-induced protein [Devosia sp.]|nr:nutrient deprivation-induced protein [Devosia sp.]